ncbi:hypothetical protein H6F67_00950 [Microcoleus sp. FACHB-1515]|uniref:hypothetical protein n=1 Tax=Cyanophyceae TaxID=3028117 RepID=UPI0016843EF0|nr:hypothetical protein [Microcoleus sp. FACHB-1515]MBD2088439.1 hypothetical protein [Microcoleus sp. FACHB-1515]
MVNPQRETPHQPQASRFSAQLKMFLVQLLQQRPLIFWGGIWAIALILISGSIATLLDPTVSRRIALHELFPPPQPIAAPSPVASAAPTTAVSPASPTPIATPPTIQAEQPTIPYRSLGAIILGCGVGSIVISQLMNRSPQPQRLHSASSTAKRPPAIVQPPKTATSNLAQASAPTAYQMPPTLTTPRSKPRVAQSQPASPTVTVVPAEASHTLDWDENSLVNTMDIRKRRSLSSWM